MEREVGQHIQQRFDASRAIVTRGPGGLPGAPAEGPRRNHARGRKTTRSAGKCPAAPDWSRPFPESRDQVGTQRDGQEDTREIKRSVDSITPKALEEYRRAYQSRHKILNGFMPFWRSLDKTLGQVDKKLTGLQDTSARIDAQMEKYEQINKKTDKAEHA